MTFYTHNKPDTAGGHVMMFHFHRFQMVLIVALFQITAAFAEAQTFAMQNLEEVFSLAGVKGTFVAYTPASNRTVLVNKDRAAERFFPASTFKIANSLIALETNAVGGVDEIIPHGGKPQPIKSWERDMSMREAIKVSNVPIYQEIARRIGKGGYQHWLARMGYGNQAVGDEVTRFWLEGPLKISAIEQTRFLARLAKRALPVSSRAQFAVREIIRLERSGEKILYGKTGWTNASTPDTGWFVGWVEGGSEVHTFALNIDIKNRYDAKLRKTLTKEFLRRLGLY